MCVQDLPTGADSCMTSLSVDPANSNMIVGGCGDGTVRIFDKRLSPSDWLDLSDAVYVSLRVAGHQPGKRNSQGI